MTWSKGANIYCDLSGSLMKSLYYMTKLSWHETCKANIPVQPSLSRYDTVYSLTPGFCTGCLIFYIFNKRCTDYAYLSNGGINHCTVCIWKRKALPFASHFAFPLVVPLDEINVHVACSAMCDAQCIPGHDVCNCPLPVTHSSINSNNNNTSI